MRGAQDSALSLIVHKNTLEMDNNWMHANLGITKSAGSMVNCGINRFVEDLEIQMSQMVLRGNTHNCKCHHNYMD